jgi:hypothetical protein
MSDRIIRASDDHDTACAQNWLATARVPVAWRYQCEPWKLQIREKPTAFRTCEKNPSAKLGAYLLDTANRLDLLGNSFSSQKGYRAAYSRLTSG